MSIQISSLTSSPGNAANQARTVSQAGKQAQQPAKAAADQPKQDTVTLGGQSAADTTYANPRTTAVQAGPDLAALLEESNRKAQEIINLILPLVEQQGLNLAKVVSGEQKLSADPETIASAKAAIAEDGEFGVQKTAERILSFAKAMINADPARFEAVQAAVEKGFQEAADILGGALPDISKQTLAAVRAQFDTWKQEGLAGGETGAQA